jgi:polysaccharide export outer membrane protein
MITRAGIQVAILTAALLWTGLAAAQAYEPPSPVPADPYRIQPGDILAITVWKEEDLQGDVLVRTDGGVSFPLAGEILAVPMTIEELRKDIARRLEKYIPNPVVTVALKQSGGNRIYVLGKVNRPGEFPFGKPIDVMQAISLAGGTTSYASLDDIKILRRKSGGNQDAINFRYSEVAQGRGLEQNILLISGDTVVVP